MGRNKMLLRCLMGEENLSVADNDVERKPENIMKGPGCRPASGEEEEKKQEIIEEEPDVDKNLRRRAENDMTEKRQESSARRREENGSMEEKEASDEVDEAVHAATTVSGSKGNASAYDPDVTAVEFETGVSATVAVERPPFTGDILQCYTASSEPDEATDAAESVTGLTVNALTGNLDVVAVGDNEITATAIVERPRFTGDTLQCYTEPETQRIWFWHATTGACFFDDGWKKFSHVDGRPWWWNEETQEWFFEADSGNA